MLGERSGELYEGRFGAPAWTFSATHGLIRTMPRHEVYCLPFGAGFGPEAFLGAFESEAAAPKAAKRRDAHTRIDQAQVKACLCCYVIRPPGEVWDASLEARLAALKDGTAPTLRRCRF